MATSKLKINKICEWCGSEFEAQKCTTRYCSRKCIEHAGKDRLRRQRKQTTETLVKEQEMLRKKEAVAHKTYLSVQEAADFLGLKRNAVYHLIYQGKLRAYRLTARITRIAREDIEEMIKSTPYVRMEGQTPVLSSEEGVEITEFYSTKEVSEKFEVCIQHVFRKGKKHNIPKKNLHGKTFWSKEHCDRVFRKKETPPSADDWISFTEARNLFDLTHDQLRRSVARFNLHTKKVGKYVYVLRSELDNLYKPDQTEC